MFKKILSLALVIATILSMAVLFSSCASHEHTFGAYTYDDTNHWRPATCEHTDIKDKEAPHSDVDADGKCDICDFEMKKPDDSGNNNNNDKPVTPKPVNKTYTVTVVNASGAPVAGAEVVFFNGEVLTLPKTTNANGQASATLLEGAWQVMLSTVPEGYAENTTRYTFTDGVVTITLQSK